MRTCAISWRALLRRTSTAHDRTLAWLARLAAALKNEGAEEFLLERMQPTWLQSRGQLWSYRAVLTLTSAAVFGLGVVRALPTDIVHGGVMTRALEINPNLRSQR